MKRVVIGGNFRNACRYLDVYEHQFNALERALRINMGAELHGVFAEGDHYDDTREELDQRFGARATIVKREHGERDYGSVDLPERWKLSGWVSNGVLENLPAERFDAFIWVETDLLWEPTTMLELLYHLEEVPACAAMCFAKYTGLFYDTFGHRKNGVRFTPNPPYHPELAHEGLTKIDSAGSCFAMIEPAARVVSFSLADSIIGIGRSLYESGYSFWLDPQLKVIHP